MLTFHVLNLLKRRDPLLHSCSLANLHIFFLKNYKNLYPRTLCVAVPLEYKFHCFGQAHFILLVN